MAMLPVFAATTLAIAIYIIIGPAFAAPRTGLVAYEIGAKPFIDDTTGHIFTGQFRTEPVANCYTPCVFHCHYVIGAFPGKLLDSVGKVLTPILLILLVGLAASVMFLPASEVGRRRRLSNHPLTKGILEGYNTMGYVSVLDVWYADYRYPAQKGIDQPSAQTKYLIRAAFIAAAGLAFVYVSLFF